MTYEDKETVDEIKAELEETKQFLKDKIIDKDSSGVGIRTFRLFSTYFKLTFSFIIPH